MGKKKLRKCPVCGHESWPIAYGMMTPDAMEELPAETVFAGCAVVEEQRVYPATGQIEYGVPSWQCQNDQCRHQWW
ncbi:hypothetical protein [Arthrobacter monumenti]